MADSPIAVSACLLGQSCRYDAQSRPSSAAAALAAQGPVLALCPEEMGGLGTPRPRAEIVGGDGASVLRGQARVIDEHGRDITDAFVAGARAALEAAQRAGVREAWLKTKSPSCGCDGLSHHGGIRPGMGVTAALFAEAGIALRPVDADRTPP